MPDTGDPWKVPYPVPQDFADDPTQSQARAQKIHDDLNILQGRINDVTASLAITNTNLATTNTNVTNLTNSIPGQIAGHAQPYFICSAGSQALPGAWASLKYTNSIAGTAAYLVSDGSIVVSGAGLYVYHINANFHTKEAATVIATAYVSLDPLGFWSARGTGTMAQWITGSGVVWLNAGAVLSSRIQGFGTGASPVCDSVNVSLARVSG